MNIIKNLYSKRYISTFIIISFLSLIICYFMFNPHYLTFDYWGNADNINRSEILRNLGLIFIGIIAILIALWRGIIASKELKNSNIKLNNKKLHKAVELLETNSELNKISAFLMLSELIRESDNFDNIIFNILSLYLTEHSNIKTSFKLFKDNGNFNIENWYERKIVDFSILFCFENYVKIINKNKIYHNINQHVLFSNLDLHGLRLEMPNEIIFRSDFSNCVLYCKEHTKFVHCDLTNAIIYPYKNNGLIFGYCNISGLQFTVKDDVEPLLNGWHWKNEPPKLHSYWRFYTTPGTRRVIIMSPERIADQRYKEKYYKEPYDLEKPIFSPGLKDDFKYDSLEQKIVNELDYN